MAKVDILQKRIAQDSLNPNLYLQLGDAYCEAGKYAEAIAEYLKVIAIDAVNVNANIGIGETYLRQSKMENAIKFFQKALELDHSSIGAKKGLFEAYHQGNNFDLAIEFGENIILSEPRNLDVHKKLYSLYKEKQLTDKIINQVELMLDIAPDDTEIINEAADFYANHDQTQKAINYYIKLSELDPNDGSISIALARLYCLSASYDKCIQLIKIHSSEFNKEEKFLAAIYFAYSNIKLGNKDQVIDELIKQETIVNIELDSTDRKIFSDVCFQAGKYYKQAGNIENAVRYFTKAVKLETEDENYKKELSDAENQLERIKRRKRRRLISIVVPLILIVSIAFYFWYTGPYHRSKVEKLFNQAKSYYSMYYYDKAIALFKEYLVEEPGNSQALYYLTKALVLSKPIESAVKSYLELAKTNMSLASDNYLVEKFAAYVGIDNFESEYLPVSNVYEDIGDISLDKHMAIFWFLNNSNYAYSKARLVNLQNNKENVLPCYKAIFSSDKNKILCCQEAKYALNAGPHNLIKIDLSGKFEKSILLEKLMGGTDVLCKNDGSIFYVSGLDLRLYKVDKSGNNQEKLYNFDVGRADMAQSYSHPSISYNTNLLVFTKDLGKGRGHNFEVFLYDYKTESLTQITNVDGDCIKPVISPDGKMIVYKKKDKWGDNALMVWNLEDSSSTRITRKGLDFRSWLFDRSGKLVCVTQSWIRGEASNRLLTFDLSKKTTMHKVVSKLKNRI